MRMRQAEGAMRKLPKRNWISLQETLDLVVDETNEPQEVVKPRLLEAFIDEEIETRGDGQSLQGSVWRSADVSWADNALNPRLDETEKVVETPAIKSPIDTLPGGVTYAEYEYDERLGEVLRPILRPIQSNEFGQVQVRREDVVRWLDPDEAPAGEDEARTTIKEKSKTGGKRKRERKISENAALKNRIESVIARARTRWPAPMRHPSPYAMAKALCDDEPDKKLQDYAESTVKQILGGTYPLITHLGISPLN